MAEHNAGNIERVSPARFEIEFASDATPEQFLGILSPLLRAKTGVDPSPKLTAEAIASVAVKPLFGLSTEDWLKSRYRPIEERRQRSPWKSKALPIEEAVQ